MGCQRPRHPQDTDISDRPQSEARSELAESLPDLLFVPATAPGVVQQYLLRPRLFTATQEAVSVVSSRQCVDLSVKDTSCKSSVRVFRWNKSDKKYDDFQSFLTPYVTASTALDLSHTNRDQLLLTHYKGKNRYGLSIWGKSQQSDSLVLWKSFDSTVPESYVLPDRSYALIEFDSTISSKLATFQIEIPRKYYRAQNASVVEMPSDSFWYQLILHTKDSTHQVYLLVRDEALKGKSTIVPEHELLTRLLITDALYDTSWVSAQALLRNELDHLSARLPSRDVTTILAVLGSERLGPIIHVANPRRPLNIAMLTLRFDDALDIKDYRLALSLMQEAVQTTRDAEYLRRMAQVALSRTATFSDPENPLIYQSLYLLRLATNYQTRSATLWRDRGYLEQRLGYADSALVMFQRSLMLDSTSTEAQHVRSMLIGNPQ